MFNCFSITSRQLQLQVLLYPQTSIIHKNIIENFNIYVAQDDKLNQNSGL